MVRELTAEVQAEINRASLQVVRELRNKPGYGFLAEDDWVAGLVARACQDWQAGDLPDTGVVLEQALTRIAKGIYAEALYRGCRGDKRSEQSRAYEELGSYLYRIAYNFFRTRGCPTDLAEACTQDTLLQIHRSLNRIEKPGGFLGYAITTLNRICSRQAREAIQRGESEQAPRELEPEDVPSLPAPVTSLLLDCLLHAMARLPNKDWRMALVLEHFAGFDDGETALVLGTTRGNIQVMRHRAIASLRDDPAFADCLTGSE